MNHSAHTGFITPIALDRDTFMRRLIASLGLLNEGILGSDITGAYIMNVGLSMGAAIEAEYKRFWGIERLFTLDEYAHVIVDLKRKIQGNFSLVSKDPLKVVVRTTSCPFDEFVRQSPSLCFMTSSVFGGIAARNFGYAKVVLHKRIALGDAGCYVTVHLQRTPEAESAIGKEYFPDITQASSDIAQQLRLMEHVHHLRRQLGETTSRWEEVLQAAAEAIGALDLDGRVIYANAHWRELLGVEGDEVVENIFERMVHPDDQDSAHAMLQRALQGEHISQHLLRLKHRDETWRMVRMSVGTVRDDQGHIVGTLSILHDITAEYEAQRLKDELLTTASHDLRTPVTTIRGMTQVLLRALEQGKPLDPAALTKRLQTIQRETDRLVLLGRELADAARIQVGTLNVQREYHDLHAIVEYAVERQRELLDTAQRYNIIVHRTALRLPVLVEEARIEQVVANLLDNAIKYSPEGGEILVTTAVQENSALVHITDQGIGIPPDDLPKLSTPFFRASNASSRHFPGLGLGLYLSRAVIEAHGGTLSVTSIEGQGTTCTISLPISSSEQ